MCWILHRVALRWNLHHRMLRHRLQFSKRQLCTVFPPQIGGPAARVDDAEAAAAAPAAAAVVPAAERVPKPAGPAGGAYIPPFKLAQMMRDAEDKEGKVRALVCPVMAHLKTSPRCSDSNAHGAPQNQPLMLDSTAPGSSKPGRCKPFHSHLGVCKQMPSPNACGESSQYWHAAALHWQALGTCFSRVSRCAQSPEP